ncbi:hypothetical protein EDB89DRAFT_1900224 [Lactarius sanguifluus]|nr:hypothetical protein EDB89DRAFT_1900224 [Lactarius sanguifluus]
MLCVPQHAAFLRGPSYFNPTCFRPWLPHVQSFVPCQSVHNHLQPSSFPGLIPVPNPPDLATLMRAPHPSTPMRPRSPWTQLRQLTLCRDGSPNRFGASPVKDPFGPSLRHSENPGTGSGSGPSKLGKKTGPDQTSKHYFKHICWVEVTWNPIDNWWDTVRPAGPSYNCNIDARNVPIHTQWGRIDGTPE